MNDSIKSSVLLLASIILARFFLPANITPILAMAIFLPQITENRTLQSFSPHCPLTSDRPLFSAFTD